jgi:YfiH family protein
MDAWTPSGPAAGIATVGNLEITDIGPRRYARFPKFAAIPGLRHAFATRPMDVSARTDSGSQERAARRRQMALDLDFDPERVLHCVQVHETRIAVVDRPRPGGPLEGFDGIVTNQVGVPIMTFSADCPLVLLYDSQAPALALVHASWRCTVGLIVAQTVALMIERLNCRPDRMHAGIGPSAGPSRYEVKQDVYEAASRLPNRDRCFMRRDGRLFFDLWNANRIQLANAGISDSRIEVAEVCTITDTRVFYSYRREGPGCGHFGLMAGLTAGSRP